MPVKSTELKSYKPLVDALGKSIRGSSQSAMTDPAIGIAQSVISHLQAIFKEEDIGQVIEELNRAKIMLEGELGKKNQMGQHQGEENQEVREMLTQLTALINEVNEVELKQLKEISISKEATVQAEQKKENDFTFTDVNIDSNGVMDAVQAETPNTPSIDKAPPQKTERSLQEISDEISKKIGSYDQRYRYKTGKQILGKDQFERCENMPFNLKPSQQALSNWECNELFAAENKVYETKAAEYKAYEAKSAEARKNMPKLSAPKRPDSPPLSKTKDGSLISPKQITINNFQGGKNGLTLSAEQVKELIESPKTYAFIDNMNKISKEVIKRNGEFDFEKFQQLSESKVANLSTQICLVQKVHLLVEMEKSPDGDAVIVPRTGTVPQNEPPTTVISTAGLDYTKDAADISPEEARKLLLGMYTNIFRASEGCDEIHIPPIGLGVFLGAQDNPTLQEERAKIYFLALKTVATENPNVKVFYNPGRFSKEFNEIMSKPPQQHNVAIMNGECLSFARERQKLGIRVALVNPSDEQVIRKKIDPGCYWKTGKGGSFVLEELIGALTTIVFGGGGVNQRGYSNENVITHSALRLNLDIKKVESVLMQKEMSNVSGILKKQLDAMKIKKHSALPFQRKTTHDTRNDMIKQLENIQGADNIKLLITYMKAIASVDATTPNYQAKKQMFKIMIAQITPHSDTKHIMSAVNEIGLVSDKHALSQDEKEKFCVQQFLTEYAMLLSRADLRDSAKGKQAVAQFAGATHQYITAISNQMDDKYSSDINQNAEKIENHAQRVMINDKQEMKYSTPNSGEKVEHPTVPPSHLPSVSDLHEKQLSNQNKNEMPPSPKVH